MAKFTTNFMSEALKYPISLDVILPADKMVVRSWPTPEKNRPYKTLYVLEGVLGNSSGPVNYSRIMPLAEDYNLAVVIVGGENMWWSNTVATGQKYADMVVRDVVNFTRRVFNLSRKREDTYIGGFSMGGHGAFVLGLGNPDIFSRIIALNSALNKNAVIDSSNEKTWDLFKKDNYLAMFNLKNTKDYENSRDDYEFLAKEIIEKKKPMPEIFMACGTSDVLMPANIELRDYLKNLGFQVHWAEFEGGHNYYSFDIGMEMAISSWLPTEDNFRKNFIYYGPEASTEKDFCWSNWSAWYNMELEAEKNE